MPDLLCRAEGGCGGERGGGISKKSKPAERMENKTEREERKKIKREVRE
jgi:hypothetical protein